MKRKDNQKKTVLSIYVNPLALAKSAHWELFVG